MTSSDDMLYCYLLDTVSHLQPLSHRCQLSFNNFWWKYDLGLLVRFELMHLLPTSPNFCWCTTWENKAAQIQSIFSSFSKEMRTVTESRYWLESRYWPWPETHVWCVQSVLSRRRRRAQRSSRRPASPTVLACCPTPATAHTNQCYFSS